MNRGVRYQSNVINMKGILNTRPVSLLTRQLECRVSAGSRGIITHAHLTRDTSGPLNA